MKVVVTGGAGRAGRWVVEELLASHEVTIFDRVAPAPASGARVVLGDVGDLGQVYGALAGADAVVHLAAIPTPLRDPPEVVFGTNVMGTFNVAEAAATLGLRKLVYSSSGSALGFAFRTREMVPDYLPLDEAHPLRPQDPYGLSKWLGEEIVESVSRRTGLRTIVLRPTTIFTPDSYAERVPRLVASPSRNSILAYVDARDFAQAVRLAVENQTIVHERFFVTADDALADEPLCELFPRLYPGSEGVAAGLAGTESPVSSAKAKALLGYRPRFRWRDQIGVVTAGGGGNDGTT